MINTFELSYIVGKIVRQKGEKWDVGKQRTKRKPNDFGKLYKNYYTTTANSPTQQIYYYKGKESKGQKKNSNNEKDS